MFSRWFTVWCCWHSSGCSFASGRQNASNGAPPCTEPGVHQSARRDSGFRGGRVHPVRWRAGARAPDPDPGARGRNHPRRISAKDVALPARQPAFERGDRAGKAGCEDGARGGVRGPWPADCQPAHALRRAESGEHLLRVRGNRDSGVVRGGALGVDVGSGTHGRGTRFWRFTVWARSGSLLPWPSSSRVISKTGPSGGCTRSIEGS